MFRRFFATFFETPSVDLFPVTILGPTKADFFSKSGEFENIQWIKKCAPCFPVSGDKITILQVPSAFYETLVVKCLNSKQRIKLASLYLGTGQLEQHLVAAIHDNLKENKELTVDILLDFTRGTRGEINSKTKLLPLIQESKKCVLSLYHTPSLRGITKKLAPPRWNELLGLQHMKIYLFDDTVILSGANLSNDYFTNRQDRYIMIEDKNLADFYSKFISKVQEFSLKVESSGAEVLHDKWRLSPYESNLNEFTKAAKTSISDFLNETMSIQEHFNNNSEHTAKADTWIFPTLEMGPIGLHHDSIIIKKLLSSASCGSKINLATGYFNLTDTYMNTITHNCPAACNILIAHPNANGFQGAKGPMGSIPKAYTLIAKRFYDSVVKARQAARINILEYERSGWTYHAKGIWYYLPLENMPSMTVVGSSNYGERSMKRDLEAQVCVITKNQKLQQQLQQECENLYQFGKLSEREIAQRPIPRWVKAVVWLFKNFF